MMIQPYLVHALSPLHAGTGQSVDTVDLPIARMRSTGIPFMPGSSVKGVLRDRSRARKDKDKRWAVFGPDQTDASAHAGAFGVADARLLALPMRSFAGVFAWVSSPLLLALARRDLVDAGLPDAVPALAPLVGRCARATSNSQIQHKSKLYLDELNLPAKTNELVDQWAAWLRPLVSPGTDILSSRFTVVDDDTMSFLLETATQIDARVRIDESAGTVADGALWYEESLPPETLLLGLAMADRSRRSKVSMNPKEVLNYAMPMESTIQLGGKASVGRGRCRVLRITNEEQNSCP